MVQLFVCMPSEPVPPGNPLDEPTPVLGSVPSWGTATHRGGVLRRVGLRARLVRVESESAQWMLPRVRRKGSCLGAGYEDHRDRVTLSDVLRTADGELERH